MFFSPFLGHIAAAVQFQEKSYNKDPFPDSRGTPYSMEKSPNLQFPARSYHPSSSDLVSLQAHKSQVGTVQGSGMIRVNSSLIHSHCTYLCSMYLRHTFLSYQIIHKIFNLWFWASDPFLSRF